MFILIDLAVLVAAVIVWYFILPAVSLFSLSFVGYLMAVSAIIFFINIGFYDDSDAAKTGAIAGGGIFCILLALLLIAGLGSVPVFRAKSYAQVINNDDITPMKIEDYTPSIDNVPLMDADTAELLANRTMGTLVNEVSQYKLGKSTQINYQGRPVRVVPLEYADIFKWVNNNSVGIPAYITVDMQTAKTDIHYLEHGMKYSPSACFGEDLTRFLRFKFPTKLLGTPVFEIDDDGNPFWIVPVIKHSVGMYGGNDVDSVVVVDAIDGEIEHHSLGDVPSWIDNVYPSDMLIEHYDWYGQYQDGFLNSIFSQKGVINTTKGYNYIPKDDDVYLYTGVTSVASDESNIGFIFVNKRTHQYEYYEVPGAEEYSAMDSAMGQIQHLGYTASFPLLLQIEGQPTYCMALKDAGGLVKMYGLVNMTEYRIVVTAETIEECQTKYRVALKNNGQEVPEQEMTLISGIVEGIKTANLDGTTLFYVKLENKSSWYVLSLADNEEAVLLENGYSATFKVTENEGIIIPAYLDTWEQKKVPEETPEPQITE